MFGHFSRPSTMPLRKAYSHGEYKRSNYFFNQRAPQPLVGALDKDFRQRAFQLVTRDKPLSAFSHEEKATADAFVTYDEDFQAKAQRLRESKKPITDLSTEERRTMEFYVNYDKEFKEITEEVVWRDYPTDDVDEIRTLYVNFNTNLKKKGEDLAKGAYCFDQNDNDRRETFLCANYHQGFQEKTQALINNTENFSELGEAELRVIKTYVNLHKGFEDRATSLIEGFRTVESISEEEKDYPALCQIP